MQKTPHPPPIVRPAAAEDVQAIGQLAEVAGLFPASLLPDMIADNLAGSDNQIWHVAELTGKLLGFAFAEPEQLTDRTWNLRAIAVDPTARRRGLATSLLAGVETALRARGGRLLLIDTTDGDDQEAARALYSERAYEEEARIRNFWEAGVGKVVFCKTL